MIGCDVRYRHGGADDTSEKQTFQEHRTLTTQPATSVECPAGGAAYVLFDDQNQNGLIDVEEDVLSRQIVCNGEDGEDGSSGSDGSNGSNGANGQDGFTTLFNMDRVATGLNACASGSGLQISAGVDGNRSGVLDGSEISQAQVLCDGQNGAVGAAGPAGMNGVSMVYQTVAASVNQCASGGSNILMALDVSHTGVYSPSQPGQQAITICNGRDGANGEDGEDGEDGTDGHDGQNATLPAYSTVESIMPCGNTVAYKEVLLRLQNGEVLASFSQNTSGDMTRLAFIPDGTYMNTDGSGCVFSLATSGATRSISWSGQVQRTWSMQ